MKVTRFFSSIVVLSLSGLVLGGGIHFFPEKDCNGAVQYEELDIPCGVCINSPNDSGAALVDNVSLRHRVTVHALNDCTEDSITVEVRQKI